jgi:ferrochelatase
VLVRHAMRYGNPSIASQLDALKAEGATRILILPLYPQYSATTTASVFDAVYTWAARTRNVPELRFVNRYHDDPATSTPWPARMKRTGNTMANPTSW